MQVRHCLLAIAAILFVGSCQSQDSKLGKKPANSPTIARATPADVASAMAHQELLLQNRFPSATTCRPCHEKQYKEWAVSPHAYSQMSPVFNAMHGTVLKLTNGTNGDFCMRCHSPVGSALGEPLFTSIVKRHAISREGVTCIACHRVNKTYGKVSGRLAIVEGGVLKPIYGSIGNKELERVLSRPDLYRVVTEEGKSGRKIHRAVKPFFTLSTSGFCGTCHAVKSLNGFRLKGAFNSYKTSPAAAAGVSCQDCHMGKTPGKPDGYELGPAAIVGGKKTRPRRLTNHMMVGPDYSILHPGLYPFSTDAQQMATINQWVTFKYKKGWGTDDFEDKVDEKPGSYKFPKRWSDPESRYDARELIEAQIKLLDRATKDREILLRNGYHLGKIVVDRVDDDGIEFQVEIKNATDGHSVPTGFKNERLIWIQVTVTDAKGKVIFQSGDLDPNGDLRDAHSLYVRNGHRPRDRYLFSLQSLFLNRLNRGGERERVLSVNRSIDPLPFLRPATFSTALIGGKTKGVRIHAQVIPPLGNRWGSYKIAGGALTGNRPYKANVKLMAASVPINLVNAIKGVGFDYQMSARQVAEGILAGHLVLWERTIVLNPRK